MANNVFQTRPNILVATAAKSFVEAGITSINTTVIYEAGPTGYLSYRPNRTINQISGFKNQVGYGYLIYTKTDLDLTDFLAQPLPAGGGDAEFINDTFTNPNI